MIKISIQGLKDYQDEYFQIMKPVLMKNIDKVKIDSKYESELKKLLKDNIKTILIGEINELDIFFDKILEIYSLNIEDYLLFDFFYCCKCKKKETISKKLKVFNSYEVYRIQTDVEGLLSKEARREYMKFNYHNYYMFFEDREKVKDIFNYEKLIGQKSLRHEILTKINAIVCPYCGRQFITSYKIKNKTKTTAALDHFYSKSKYPFFSLSLFNFIPTCTTCNSLMKGFIDFYKNKHLYPYKECFGENAQFILKGNRPVVDYIHDNNFNIDININTLDKDKIEKIKNNISTFKLKEVYQNHNEVVSNLLYKIHIYKPSYIKEIARILNLDENIVEYLIFEIPDEDDILGKLKSDILKQYKL